MTPIEPPSPPTNGGDPAARRPTDDATRRSPQLPPAFTAENEPASSVGGTIDEGSEATVLSGTSEAAHVSVAEVGRRLEGQALGVYELEQFVGGGGMGAVFRARDTTLDRIVAVKVLFQHRSRDDEMLRRFQNEAQSAARLDHENIGRVYAVGCEQGWHFIVFEYIEGINLRDLVNAAGPFDPRRTIEVVTQIADALSHAAARDVVHRDIKPSNVIVTPTGRARLVDMGLARLHHMAGDQDLTVSGMTLGTFDYISPEQARDPRLADVRSDLYSLGCTAFFLLTGRPPFAEGTMVQKLLKHQQDPPPAIESFRGDVPRRLVAVLARLMAKRPEDRYEHPHALVTELAEIAEEEGIDLALPRGPVVRPARGRRPLLRRHLSWLVPTAALAAIVLGMKWSSERKLDTNAEARQDGAVPAAAMESPPEADAAVLPARGTRLVVAGGPGKPEAAGVYDTLAAAAAAAADGAVIELSYDGVRDEMPFEIAGKRLTIRAAENADPEVRFGRRGDAEAGITLADGEIECRDLGLRFESSPNSVGPGCLFHLLGGSSLQVEDCRIEVVASGSAGGVDGPRCIEAVTPAVDRDEIEKGPASRNGELPAGVSVRFRRSRVVGASVVVLARGGGNLTLTWSGGGAETPGRFLLVEGSVGDAAWGTGVEVIAEEAIFDCGEGFALLLDSLTRPLEPRLKMVANACRFRMRDNVPLVEQSGIEDPDIYQARVEWVDGGSRYEGGHVFRRIDGAAERIEIDYATAPQPLEHVPLGEPRPDDSAADATVDGP